MVQFFKGNSFDLKKGDLDNLIGEVIIYSKIDLTNLKKILSPDLIESMPPYIIESMPPNFKKLLSSFSKSKEIIIASSLSFSDISDEVDDNFFSDKINIPGLPNDFLKNKKIIPGFSKEKRFNSEKEILDEKCDVLYAVYTSIPNIAYIANKLGIMEYIKKFIGQNIPKFFENENQYSKNSFFEKPTQKAPSSYTEIKPKDTRETIEKYFVNPMIKSYTNKDTLKLNKLKDDFLSFCKGNNNLFFSANELSDLIINEEAYKSKDLRDAYLDKIHAVETQEYEVAAKKRDLIQELTKIN
jgi:hypothetical protein